jgi:hypothetical protein
MQNTKRITPLPTTATVAATGTLHFFSSTDLHFPRGTVHIMSSQKVLKHAIVGYPWLTMAIASLGLLLSYVVWNVIHQCYYSPLAKFPGPKLAAVTRLYEVYYDVFKWGRYTFEIEEMHKRYGERPLEHSEKNRVKMAKAQLSALAPTRSISTTQPFLTSYTLDLHHETNGNSSPANLALMNLHSQPAITRCIASVAQLSTHSSPSSGY